MFDIIQSADALFRSNAVSCMEILPEFICEYKLQKNNLPSENQLLSFLSQTPHRDKIAIMLTTESGSAYIGSDVLWTDDYAAFVDGLFEDDEITTTIKVTKGNEDGTQSIYCIRKFSSFICGLSIERVFENFTALFRDNGNHIVFELLDSDGMLRTRTIAFSNNSVTWVDQKPRTNFLKDCDDASIFLERSRIRLAPQDFEIIAVEGSALGEISQLFDRLRTVLAYVYLSNTATIQRDRAVLQFDPTTKGNEYALELLANNQNVIRIFDWIYSGDSCVDKASIARKIINTYCRTADSILNIDERVLNSIKSDYIIYQKNHADQYIEMKNRISDYIVESAEKIQELSHDITDAFRNNFVAVIVFLMTVLLTDSIDFLEFIGRDISPKVTAVCAIFSIATLLYLIATVFMGNKKWIWLEQSYNDLKKNYTGVFDEKDIDEAFHHDEPLNNAEKQYRSIRKTIGGIWVALFLALASFTGVLMLQGHHAEQMDSVQAVQQSPDFVNETEATDHADRTDDEVTKLSEDTSSGRQENAVQEDEWQNKMPEVVSGFSFFKCVEM